MTRKWKVAAAVAVSVLTAACGLFDDDEDIVVVISADALVASPSEPVILQVTAENRGDSRVVWGRGSSSCQLGLLARVDGKIVRALEERVCTADLVPQGLAPGESRTEELRWSGYVIRDGASTRLPPGSYEIRGIADDAAWSRPVRVTLRDD